MPSEQQTYPPTEREHLLAWLGARNHASDQVPVATRKERLEFSYLLQARLRRGEAVTTQYAIGVMYSILAARADAQPSTASPDGAQDAARA